MWVLALDFNGSDLLCTLSWVYYDCALLVWDTTLGGCSVVLIGPVEICVLFHCVQSINLFPNYALFSCENILVLGIVVFFIFI
jgi:hypothetical protein